ncbi:MAG: peptidoglycan bridge formation glycyltransferase FemA/FemB family protein [Bacilli bacterium]|nr:peptidoglycan bridge formation glycyltransferase FemA/FemB family protein [Bacilli bacterium]
MTVREIDGETFNEFANNHPLKNFYQTKEYGDLMIHSDFSVMFVGGFEDDSLVAASLILYKTICPSMKYGYAPRGFLVDYYNSDTLKKFTKAIKDYFFKKSFAFIKINPEITYSTIDFNNKSKLINSKNKKLVEEMKKMGYDKLKDNLYFESMLPKYTPVIYLPKYNFEELDSKIINNARNGELSGIRLVTGNETDIPTLYSFVQNKGNKTEVFYKVFYDIFKKSEMVDLLLVELNYQTYVKFLQKQYAFEQENNDRVNKEFEENTSNMDIYNKKMKSDQTMSRIQSEIVIANQKMQENRFRQILGAAFVIKHQGRITVYISGQSDQFQGIDIKSFMYYKIIEGYKKAGYLFLDLYGITADFSDTNPYKKLNDFKLSFKPNVYEYIGELDLIVNKPFHQLLWATNKIQHEFYKPAIKK